MEAMFAMLETPPTVRDAPSAATLRLVRGDIQFENVSFAYSPQERCILSNISFFVPGGATYAIVGTTGSGKVRRQLLKEV